MEFLHSSLVLCIHTPSPEDLDLRAGKLLILGVRPRVQVISHPYSVNSRGQKLQCPHRVRRLDSRDGEVGAQTGKNHPLEEKPTAPLLVSPGKAPGRLAGYSHCGTPILSLWFSSTWSHLHWAGIGHSEPEEAGVWEESQLSKKVGSLPALLSQPSRGPFLWERDCQFPLGTEVRTHEP